MTGTLRDMSLNCARLSCGLAAAASVQFNADLAQVVIIDLSDTTVGIPLCHDHTRTRTPPVGWTLIDARTGVRQGVMLDTPSTAEPDAPPVDGSGPGNRPSLRRPLDRGFVWERVGDSSDGATSAGDTTVGSTTVGSTVERAPAEAANSVDEPNHKPGSGDEGQDNEPLDGPTSPLLSRAFRAAHSDRVD